MGSKTWVVVVGTTRVTKDGNLADASVKQAFELAKANDEIVAVYFDESSESTTRISETPIGRLALENFKLALQRHAVQREGEFVPARFIVRVRDGPLVTSILALTDLSPDFVVAE